MSFDEYYFSTNNYAHVSFGKYSQYWWANRFYAILARRYGKLGSNLLEIGSGLGHLVGQLSGEFKTVGLDVNHWALVQSKVVVGSTHLEVGSAEDLSFADGSFGVVVIKHVIEHLEHPEKCAQELGRILSPNGILILATPNLDSLLKSLKGEKWHGYNDPTHIALKPPREWMEYLHSAGFKIEKIFSDGFWDVPYVRWMPKKLQKILFGLPGGLQAISGLVFLPFRWGENLIVIARRG
jgi:2-polyprenyl-3-methyl-5-hydroxy-6-metoxy-1,4-benzoquinol methylase